MAFTSIAFILFFLIMLILLRICPRNFHKYIIILASLAFYISYGLPGVVFLFITALISFCAGIMYRDSQITNAVSAFISITTIIILYLYHISGLYYPLGLSFYGLMAIGYIIDVYRGKTTPITNFIDFLACLSFFPLIQSGPIEKIQDIHVQFQKENRNIPYNRQTDLFLLILWGFIEKLSISNIAGLLVAPIFDNPDGHSWLSVILSTILFGFQLYADFDGYSNIAFGIAGLTGIEITDNFRQPYLSTSVKDFWRRWHISLSTWLKDYVYIPLGGSRCSKPRKYINLMITFIVSGLWHGTGLTYLIWGFLHGIYQIIEDVISSHRSKVTIRENATLSNNNVLSRIIRIILTFILVDFAWFFFRAHSIENAALLLSSFKTGTPISVQAIIMDFASSELTAIHIIYMFLALIALFIVDILAENKVDIYKIYHRFPIVIRWGLCYALIFWCIIAAVSTLNLDLSGFIYGQF